MATARIRFGYTSLLAAGVAPCQIRVTMLNTLRVVESKTFKCCNWAIAHNPDNEQGLDLTEFVIAFLLHPAAWNRTPTPTGDRGAKLWAKRPPRSGSSATDRPRHGKLECRFPRSLLLRLGRRRDQGEKWRARISVGCSLQLLTRPT